MPNVPGIQVTLIAFNVAGLAQTWWLWRGLHAGERQALASERR